MVDNRRVMWLVLFAVLLPVAAAVPSSVPEDDRQRILAHLADEIEPARLRAAAVFSSGDLAAVRLPAEAGTRVVYIFERTSGRAGNWGPVARITAPGEAHFGDSILLSPSTILVAAPETPGAGLGPGATYVFQRHVGGPDRWGLVAKLTPAAYPPAGAVAVRQLSADAEDDPLEVSVAAPPVTAVAPPPPAAVVPPPAAVVAPPPAVDVPPPLAAVIPPPAAVASPPTALAAGAAEAGAGKPATAQDPKRGDDSRPEATDPAAGRRYIVVANMREKPRALALASSLRRSGYPSEVHRNVHGFFVVTLAHLPLAEARRKRAEAMAAGDVSGDAYLIVGTSFQEKISP